MPSYQNIFGGITIYPSDLGFIDYTLSSNTTLVWPDLGETSSSVAAAFTRITTTTGGIAVTLPNASYASVGNALRFKNNGAATFTINSASGSTLATMSAGQDILLSITNNTTTGGLWDISYIGSGTTSAVASVLAGNGLTTSGATLKVNWPVVYTGSSGYQITTTAVGTVVTWTGGAGSLDVSVPANYDGFIMGVKNYGTGVVTLTSAANLHTFDGSDELILNPNDSTLLVGGAIISGASRPIYTVGLTSQLGESSIEIPVGTQTSISVTNDQFRANAIFILTGQINSNGVTVVFPASSKNFTVINQTQRPTLDRGGAIVTMQTTAGGLVLTMPFGATRHISSDATNLYFAEDFTLLQPSKNTIPFCDFSKNPWQRGTSFTPSTTSIYTADRVSAISLSGTAWTFTRANSTNTGCQYDLKMQKTSGSPSASGVVYAGIDLESSESISLQNKNITLAVESNFGESNVRLDAAVYYNTTSNTRIVDSISGGLSGWSLLMTLNSPNVTWTTSSRYYLFTVNPYSYNGSSGFVPTSANQVSVLVQASKTGTAAGNSYAGISRIAIVEGDFLGFDTPDIAQVQMDCQRFCYIPTVSAASQSLYGGQAVSSNGASIPVQFPVSMRKAPALTVTAFNFQVTTSTGAAAAASAITFVSGNRYGGALTVATTTALLTAGNATIMQSTTSVASMIFSADI